MKDGERGAIDDTVGGRKRGGATLHEPVACKGWNDPAADRRDEGDDREKLGLWAFWLYNCGLVLWILLNFFPIGWPQLDAVYEHGLAYARSSAFYSTTLFWQWMRLPGDVVFALGALLMAWDFIVKLRPLYPQAVDRLIFRKPPPLLRASVPAE